MSHSRCYVQVLVCRSAVSYIKRIGKYTCIWSKTKRSVLPI